MEAEKRAAKRIRTLQGMVVSAPLAFEDLNEPATAAATSATNNSTDMDTASAAEVILPPSKRPRTGDVV